jgi:hypothetical protein
MVGLALLAVLGGLKPGAGGLTTYLPALVDTATPVWEQAHVGTVRLLGVHLQGTNSPEVL